MAIQGSLEEAPLPDVIQLLSLGRKSGCLSLTERDMQGEICLEDGHVCHAAVFSRRDRLGDMLVRTGRITQQQLEDAISAHQGGRGSVSKILVESGQVERGELERYVRTQVEEAVYFMFTWRSGTFAFTSSVRPKKQEFLVAIDPEGLLLEGARRVDEWSQIEKKIPSLDLVFRLERGRLDGAHAALTGEQQQIIPLIDGARDVHGLIEATGMAEFDVGKALYGLITAGFATRVERRAAMRHLDYRELLAYVVREAEFADPGNRRAAARHIADCATCTQRLKTIHVRRTGAIPTFTTPDDASVEAAETTADVGAVTLAPRGAERRMGERRSGDERRDVERRHGERRSARSAEWEGPGRERRSGADRRVDSRRISERRLVMPDRQSAAVVAARALNLPQRPRPSERRTTGPRRVRTLDVGGAEEAAKRDTGERIRLRPADEASAPPAAATPTAARAADEPAPEPPRAERAAPKAKTKPPAPRRRAEPEVPDLQGAATVEITPARKPAPSPKAAVVTPAKQPTQPEATVEVTPAKKPAPAAEATVEVTPAKRPAASPPEATVEVTPAKKPAPPAEATVEVTPAKQPASPADEAPPRPLPAKVMPHPRPENHRPAARSTDIEWLVSPDEANHLLRTSRVGLEAPGPDAAAESKPKMETGTRKVEPKPAKPSPPKRPSPPKAVESPPTREAAPPPRTRPPVQETAEPSRPRPPAPAPPVAAPVRARAAKPAAEPTPPAGTPKVGRWVGVAAALLVVVGGAFLAGPLLRGDGAPVTTAAVLEPAAETPAAAPATPAPATVEPPVRTAPPTVASPPAQQRAEPVQQPVAPPAAQTRAAEPPVREPPPPVAQPAPAPTVGVVRGVARDAQTGAALAGVRISIPGTAFSTQTDAAGAFTFADVPAGPIAVTAAADGRVSGTRQAVLAAGGAVQVDFRLAVPEPVRETPPPPPPAPAPARPAVAPSAREADEELATGGWMVTDAAAAAAQLRGRLATIPDFWIESIATSDAASRPRARVALLTPDGDRIVLTETRSGAPAIGGTPRVTALRIIPASEAYPVTTGTASFGALLVTAKTTLPGDSLRTLLATLIELK